MATFAMWRGAILCKVANAGKGGLRAGVQSPNAHSGRQTVKRSGWLAWEAI
ncbi:MAG: hypothetical protein KC547_09085 [Anaerolineae bacterium]|nr:hypothetical protein [Anaerolineae bacterium]